MNNTSLSQNFEILEINETLNINGGFAPLVIAAGKIFLASAGTAFVATAVGHLFGE